MKRESDSFNEHKVLRELKHFLPSQASLKDFIHHNTLHAFQNLNFEKGIRKASEIFGYKVSFSLQEYRNLFSSKKISEHIVNQKIISSKGLSQLNEWRNNLLVKSYNSSNSPRVGKLRAQWKNEYRIDLDLIIQPDLFRVLFSYLDQGISIWNFPVSNKGFLGSIREMEKNTFSSFFSTERAKAMVLNEKTIISDLLNILVGEEALFEHYLFVEDKGKGKSETSTKVLKLS